MSQNNRSHPPALRKTVRDTLKECFIPNGSKILLGVSGGSDSMALLHVLYGLQKELGFSLYAVGINHGLRPEAKSELDMVRDYLSTLNHHGVVPLFIKRISLKEGGNIQERAREARYEAIREIQNFIGADFICTAHHMEDKAETVLMRIIRGTSVKGLDVLNPQCNDVLRPMIRAHKRDVMLHVQRKSIPYCEDPSNKNVDKYLRSKIRYEVMPSLQEINPNIVECLCELSQSAKNPDIMGKRLDRKQCLAQEKMSI